MTGRITHVLKSHEETGTHVHLDSSMPDSWLRPLLHDREATGLEVLDLPRIEIILYRNRHYLYPHRLAIGAGGSRAVNVEEDWLCAVLVLHVQKLSDDELCDCRH